MMNYRMGHLAFRTRDMAETLKFYVGILHFEHAFSLTDDDGNPWIEYLMLPDGRFLEFFYASESDSLSDGGYLHLCLEVDDCEAAVRELSEQGVDIRVPISIGKNKNKQAWIRDPDERDIELMEISPLGAQAWARSKK